MKTIYLFLILATVCFSQELTVDDIKKSFYQSYPIGNSQAFDLSLSLEERNNYFGSEHTFASKSHSFHTAFKQDLINQHPFLSSIGDRNCFGSFILKGKIDDLLQPGDVVLENKLSIPLHIDNLYHNFTSGFPHVSIVGEDNNNENFLQVESPRGKNLRSFKEDAGYTILRLKKFPGEIDSHISFEEFINDSEKVATFIEEYENRKLLIEDYVEQVKDWKYEYIFDLEGGDPLPKDYIQKC
ncbi:hypothetical protein N9N67_11145, partial [Bacteriovoracaceae bacterium]|nr:hypothetical protein [Bacteriovoracaceae bacterium]